MVENFICMELYPFSKARNRSNMASDYLKSFSSLWGGRRVPHGHGHVGECRRVHSSNKSLKGSKNTRE